MHVVSSWCASQVFGESTQVLFVHVQLKRVQSAPLVTLLQAKVQVRLTHASPGRVQASPQPEQFASVPRGVHVSTQQSSPVLQKVPQLPQLPLLPGEYTQTQLVPLQVSHVPQRPPQGSIVQTPLTQNSPGPQHPERHVS